MESQCHLFAWRSMGEQAHEQAEFNVLMPIQRFS